MARSIDERVVQMRFDNKQFEQNAQTTLGTLGRLKEALNNSNTPAKAFEDIGRAASRMDLSGIGASVDQLSHRFSAMGIVGMTVLQDLTRSAIGMAKSLANKTIGQITSGGYSRAQKIEDARFTLQGLLKDEKEVEAVMKNVDGAVSGTAYSYDAAASVAAQFAASGQRAGEELEANLKAVAGVAAMTNSSYEEIGHIFTTVSGQGRLMGMQLQQLSLRGMDAAQIIGDYLGVTGAEVRELVTKGKIDFQTFADAMYDAFGDQAGKANETFTGVMANIRSALSRTGAGFYAPLIAQNSALVKMLQTVRSLISDTFNKSEFWVGVQEDVTTSLLDLFKMTDEWLQSIDFDTIIKGFSALYQGAKDVASIIYTLGDFFYGFWIEVAGDPVTAKSFLTWTQSVRDAIRSFKTSLEDLDNHGFRMIMRSVYGFVIQPFMIVVELFKDLWEITAPIRTTFVELAKLFSEVGRIANHVTYNLLWDIRDAGNVFTGFGDIIADVFGRVNRTLQDWQDVLRDWSPEIIETLSGLDIAKGFDAIAGAIKNVIANFKPFEKLKTAVTTVVDFITTYLTKAKTAVIDFWNSFRDGDGAADGAEQFSSRFEKIKSVLLTVLKIFKWVGAQIWNLVKPIAAAIGSVFNSITFEDVKNIGLVGMSLMIGQALKNMLDTVAQAVDALKTFGQGGLLTKVFGDWKPTVTAFYQSVYQAKNALIQFQSDIKAGILLKIAIAVAILAGSLVVLSLVPVDRMMNALVAMAGIGAILAGVMTALQQIARLTGMTDTGKLVATTLVIAVSLSILASAVKKMGKLSSNELARGLVGLIISMSTFAAAMIAMSKMAPQMSRGITTLLAMAVSMSIIAGAIKKLAKMDFADVMSATFALLMAMGPLIVLVTVTEDVDDRSLLAVAAMIFGIVSLTKAIGKIAKTADPSNLLKVGGVLSALIGIMGAIVIGMGYLSGKMTFNYAAMGMMIGAMMSLSTSIAMISPALALLAMFDMERVIAAAVAIGIVTGVFAYAAKVLGTSGLAGAGAMTLMTIAINLMVPPLIALGIAAKPVAAGMIVLYAGMMLLSSAGQAILAAVPGLLGLSAALLGISAAVLLFSAGVFLLASAFAVFAASAAAGAAGIKLIVMTIVTMVPIATGAAVLAITNLVMGIVKLVPIIIEGVMLAITSILMALYKYGPDIIWTITALLTELFIALEFAIPRIVEFATKLLVALVQTIVTYAPVLAQALFDLVIGLINGVADLIRNNYDQVFAAVGNLLSALFEMILSLIQEFLSLIPGVGDKLSGLLDKPKQMLKDAATGGEMESAGADLADSVADGVNSSNAPEEAGQGILDKIKNGLGLGGEGTGEAGGLGDKFVSQFAEGMNGFDMSGAGAGMYDNFASGFTGGADGTGAFDLGSTMGGQINEGIVSSSEESRSAGQTLSTSVIDGATNDEGFAEAGRTNVQSFIGGMEAEGENVTTAGSQVAQKGLDGADKEAEWKGLGKDAASGFASGIDVNNYLASKAGKKLGDAAYNAAQKALDSHSPSRKFAELGKFSAVGYSGAVEKFTYLAEDATSSMGNAAIASLSSAMGDIGGIMDNVDYQPTIAPVLDLSSVQNGTQNIGNLFDRNRALAAQAGYSFDANMQSETESLLRSLAAQSDVLASIRDLLANQEIRLDTGQLVGGIAGRMDSALGTRAIRAGRGNHA